MPDPIRRLEHEPELVSPEETVRVGRQGSVIIAKLHGVLRGMRLYDPSNRALQAQQQELLESLRAMQTEDVSLLGMGEYFYVNGCRLRPIGAQLPVFRAVLAELDARRLGGLRFSAGLTLEELQAFLRVFHADRTPTAATTLEAECARTGVRNVRAIRERRAEQQTATEDEPPVQDAERHRAMLIYGRAMKGTRNLMQVTARTGRPALQQARRVVQPMVDRLLRSENSLVGLTALKRHDEYTYAHSVNVSILSIRMGQLLGLSRTDLAAIGVAGLLHDAGKIMVPAQVLCKPGRLDAREWASMRRHPMEGLRIVSRLPGISQLMVDAMRVAFEHHMNVDHGGYPRVVRPRPMGAFSRIVAVADCFDALTSHRSYRQRPLTAHEALRLLLGVEQERFERAVLWSLVQTVGIYPAGTVMRTESGRLVLSVAPYSVDPRRPICRELVAGPEGALVVKPADDAPLDEHEHVSRVLSPEDVGADIESLMTA